MKEKAWFIIFKGVLLKQINKFFVEEGSLIEIVEKVNVSLWSNSLVFSLFLNITERYKNAASKVVILSFLKL